MQAVALPWHLYQLTHSSEALGAIGLARVIPLLLFALVGGVLADALDRRRLMIVSQSVLALLAAGLGIWTLAGPGWLPGGQWPIYAVAALGAGVTAFDNPARQSLIPQLVPREVLRNAVSLNSATSQVASIGGPALAGALIAAGPVGHIYLLNAVSFLGVIVALLLMRAPAVEGERPRINFQAALEGLRFVRQSRLIISLMLLDFLATFFGSATVLLPVLAEEVLKVGPQAYGWLMAAPSIGSLLAAAVMSALPAIRRQGVVILCAVFAYGLATILFGVAETFMVAMIGLAGTGAADTVSTVLRHTIRQLHTPDELRGRMTSVNMVFFMGGPQLGEFEAGLVAGRWGAPASVVSGGIACLVTVAAMAAWAPRLRGYRGEERR